MGSFLINQDDCVDNRGNFNKGGCFIPGKLVAAFLIPVASDFLSTANLSTPATREAAIQASMVNDTYANRTFMIQPLTNPVSNGEEEQYETIDGFRQRTSVGTWDVDFLVNSATMCDYNNLQLFDGKSNQYNIAFVDDNNKLWCLEGAAGVKGFGLHAFEVRSWMLPTNTEGFKATVRIALSDRNEINKQMLWVDLGFNPRTDLKGVNDVTISEVTTTTPPAASFDICALGTCGEATEGSNLNEAFQTVWNVPGAWVFTNNAGLPITITGVTMTTVNNEIVAFRLAADTGTNYVVAQKAYINLAAISVLTGLGTSFYEGVGSVAVTLT